MISSSKKLDCGHYNSGGSIVKISLKNTGACVECIPPMFSVCSDCYDTYNRRDQIEEEILCQE